VQLFVDRVAVAAAVCYEPVCLFATT